MAWTPPGRGTRESPEPPARPIRDIAIRIMPAGRRLAAGSEVMILVRRWWGMTWCRLRSRAHRSGRGLLPCPNMPGLTGAWRPNFIKPCPGGPWLAAWITVLSLWAGCDCPLVVAVAMSRLPVARCSARTRWDWLQPEVAAVDSTARYWALEPLRGPSGAVAVFG